MKSVSRMDRWHAQYEVLLLSALLLPCAWIALRRTPLPEIRSRLAARMPRRASSSRLSATQIGRIVSAVGRRLPGIGTCLTHGLVTEALLRREHHEAQLVVGVERSGDSALRAHAWVVSDGRVVAGAAVDLERFTPLAIGTDALVLRPFAAGNPRSDAVTEVS